MKKYSRSVRNGALVALLLVGIAAALPAQNILTFDVPNATSTQPSAINQAGQITGTYSDGNGNHGFLRQVDGSFTLFDVPNNFSGLVITGVTAINAPGQIIGYLLTLDTNRYHSFLRQADGTFTLFEAPGPCQDRAEVNALPAQIGLLNSDGIVFTGINNRGQIAGVYGQILCHRSLLRQRDGTILSFGVPPDAASEPNTIVQAINSRGQATGYYLDNQTLHGFLRQPNGNLVTFDASDSNTFPAAITPAGEITGLTGGRGFLRERNGGILTFEAPQSIATQPTAINQAGQITGFYLDANNASHGFVRQRDGSLSTLDVPDASNTYPAAMNAGGRITGWYSDASGRIHGFVTEGIQTCACPVK